MTRWLVEIQGDTCDIETLAQAFTADTCEICQAHGRWFVSFSLSTDNANAVHAHAETLLGIVNVIRDLAQTHRPMSLGEVYTLGDDGQLHLHQRSPSSSSFGLGWHDGTGNALFRPKVCERLSEMAVHGDEDIRDVSLLWHNGAGRWQILLKMIEIVGMSLHRVAEADSFSAGDVDKRRRTPGPPKGDGLIAEQDWATPEQLSLLRDTINDPEVLGPIESRHARRRPTEKADPIPDGVSIDEAEKIIRRMLVQWLLWKVGQAGNPDDPDVPSGVAQPGSEL